MKIKSSHVGKIALSLALLGVGALFQGCASKASTETSEAASETALDPAAMDRSVSPCADFYQYACGGWIKTTEIPEDRPQWGRGFTAVDERDLKLLDSLLKSYAEGGTTPANPFAAKLGDFYATCMDEQKAETASMTDLDKWAKSIRPGLSPAELSDLIAKLHLAGVNVLFDFSNEQDLKDPNEMIGAADQAGLGLPDRDYYLKSDPRMKKIQNLYRAHVRNMLMLWGESRAQATRDAGQIYAIEKMLARGSMSRVERRNPEKIYHRLERAGLEKVAPRFEWNDYFNALGYPTVEALDVKTPEFFKMLNGLLKKVPQPELDKYLRWHLLSAAASTLGKSFVDEDFDFYSKALSGQKALAPRWKRCTRSVEHNLGFALGRSFVDVTFGQQGKDISEAMVRDVENAMNSDLKAIAWMDEPTRAEALKKLSKVANQIGYPSKWRDYTAMAIGRSSYLDNLFAANTFNNEYELNKMGKPVDRGEWDMPPAMVNAYYDPSMNKMVFPAGILQPPFFSGGAMPYINFSGIGMVMGHELTHGFDDQGRKFDDEGRLRDWWTAGVLKDFNQRADCVAKQYESYEVQPGIHLNGRLTLGENIADNGGIKLSYAAWSARHPDASMGERQDYFVHFAQTWCTKTKPEFERFLVTVDPHSPPRFRVDGPLTNLADFSTVFGCPAHSKMNDANRCSVW